MIENITILCNVDGKYAHIPVYTKNEDMIYGAFKMLQANPDLPKTIKAIELNKNDAYIHDISKHYKKGSE